MSFTMIPRGPGPLCSVLLPSRGRPEHLVQAVDSIYSLAVDKGNVEFIFRIDDDDQPTIDVVEKMEQMQGLKVKKIIAPRGAGYFDMHHWVDDMALLATGDWLFLFNDDARMMTETWDQLLISVGTEMPWLGIDQICLIMARTITRPLANEFFFLRRRTFDILGHVSLSPHNDNWIYSVMDFLRVRLSAPIFIDHMSDRIEDDIRASTKEAYKTTTVSLNSIQSKRLQMKDAQKLLRYLERIEADAVWTSTPTIFSWSIWKGADMVNRIMFVDPKGHTFRFAPKNEQSIEILPRPCEVTGGLWTVLRSFPMELAPYVNIDPSPAV